MQSFAPVPVPPSSLRPYEWDDNPDEPEFDARVHLAQFNFQDIKTTSIDQIYELDPKQEVPQELKGQFGYSTTFKVFSDEGYRVARAIIDKNYQDGFVKPDRRIQLCCRGICYRSKFLRDFSQSKELKDLVSEISKLDLVIHPMISNHCHLNYGVPSDDDKVVDMWHQVATAFVFLSRYLKSFSCLRTASAMF